MPDKVGSAFLFSGDVMASYEHFVAPTLIISDGPYGVSGFPGDLPDTKGLSEWYEPHIKIWTEKATPRTSLAFWNTERGWAAIHSTLEKWGWEYRQTCIWDKGLAHIAGNSNTKTLRSFPVVTEMCALYVRPEQFLVNGQNTLRQEWLRTGLPLGRANEACGCKNAATRKYLTEDKVYYPPPPEILGKLIRYANEHGSPKGRPYFVKEAHQLKINRLRSVFKCPVGITNVWSDGKFGKGERLKVGQKSVHYNQKPIKLISRLIEALSEVDDVIWEPFGGLFTAALCSNRLNRQCYAAEITAVTYQQGLLRLQNDLKSKADK